MNQDINAAVESINYIKKAIEQTKVDYNALSQLSIIFGIFHLSDSLLTLLCLYRSKYIYSVIILKIFLLIVFVASYLCIYGKEKNV